MNKSIAFLFIVILISQVVKAEAPNSNRKLDCQSVRWVTDAKRSFNRTDFERRGINFDQCIKTFCKAAGDSLMSGNMWLFTYPNLKPFAFKDPGSVNHCQVTPVSTNGGDSWVTLHTVETSDAFALAGQMGESCNNLYIGDDYQVCQ
jgi:hypothetical protein